MSKRRGGQIRIHTAKVKKRQGVGSRSITVLDSDEEDPPPTVAGEYAQATKTRVGSSGNVERVAMSTIPFLEVEDLDVCAPLEVSTDIPVDAIAKNIVFVVPAKKRWKKVNDSVSVSTIQTLWYH